MEKNSNVPKIRFRGCQGEWEKKPLSEQFSVSAELNRNNEFGKEEVLSVSREFGVINQIEYQGRSYAGVSVSGYGVVRHGDVVYTKSPLRDQPYGIIKANKGVDGIVSALYAVFKPKETISPDFVQLYFDSDERLNKYLRPIVHKGAKNTLNISDEGALAGLVSFPSRDEQSRIAECFEEIDALVSRQRERVERLRKLKAALLDKLFPKPGHTAPELRVNGCTGEWEEKKLSEFASRVTRKNNNMESELVMTISAHHGLIDQQEFFNKRIASANLQGYFLVRKGEFAYNKSYCVEYPWGAVKRLDRYDKGVVSNLYIIFNVKDIESDFVVGYFMTDLWHREVALRAKEGARNHGLLNISAEDFLSISMLVPPTRSEQRSIASLLMKYDRLIDLHEAKLAKLRQLKLSMLDKMFV